MARTYPACGTCPNMIPATQEEGWCHGVPPTVIVLNNPGNDSESRVRTTFPPVHPRNPGCTLHPDWPRGGFVRKLRSLFT